MEKEQKAIAGAAKQVVIKEIEVLEITVANWEIDRSRALASESQDYYRGYYQGRSKCAGEILWRMQELLRKARELK